MCFSGGPSADDYYKEMTKDKPEFKLPSLSQAKANRKKPKLRDVRKGAARRNLLNPMGGYNAK